MAYCFSGSACANVLLELSCGYPTATGSSAHRWRDRDNHCNHYANTQSLPDRHRKTKIKATGFIIIGATRWKESKPQVFIRKYKVKFQESGEALFEVNRICPRAVSKKEFRFQITP